MSMKLALVCTVCVGAAVPGAMAQPGSASPFRMPGAAAPWDSGAIRPTGLEVVPAQPSSPPPRRHPRAATGTGHTKSPETMARRQPPGEKTADAARDATPTAPHGKEAGASDREQHAAHGNGPGRDASAPDQADAARDGSRAPPASQNQAAATLPSPAGDDADQTPDAPPAETAAAREPRPPSEQPGANRIGPASRSGSPRCPPAGIAATRDDGESVSYFGADAGHPNLCLQSNGGRLQRLWFGIWPDADPNSRRIAEALLPVLGDPFGGKAEFDLSGRNGNWREVLENQSLQYTSVQGQRLLTVQIKETREANGPQKFRMQRSFWIDTQSGMVVRQETHEEAVTGDGATEEIAPRRGDDTWTVVSMGPAVPARQR